MAPKTYQTMRLGLVRMGRPDPGPAPTDGQALILPKGDHGCTMQAPSGLCTVHADLGESALPQVCADFPRLINRIDDRLEVTGDIACPEVARLLLTESGAEQVVALPDRVLTQRPDGGLRTQFAPPYARVANEVRGFIITLLSLDGFTPGERVVLAQVFCARTITHLHRDSTESDLHAIALIMQHLSDRPRLRAIADLVVGEPVSAELALPILDHTIRLGSSASPDSFRPLAERGITTYATPGETRSAPDIWAEYELRRAQMRARLGHYVDEAFWRLTYQDWVHSPYVLSPSLAYHAVKLQLGQSVMRWLFFAQPAMVEALAQDSDVQLKLVVDEQLVDVAYRTARAIRHSNLVDVAQSVLDRQGLDHAAACLLLARI